MTDGYVKKSSHEQFFRGIAWLGDLFIKAQWYEDFFAHFSLRPFRKHWGRENYNSAWQKLFEAENIY